MEEEKAAEYYDELLRKGGNAAKFKQGLGFGDSSAASVTNGKEQYGSLRNFVKGPSAWREAADLDKEIRIESIRDKLQKRDERFVPEHTTSRPRYSEALGLKLSDRRESKSLVTRNTPDSSESQEGAREKSRRHRRSASLERRARALARKPLKTDKAERSLSSRRRTGRKVSRSSIEDDSSSKSPEDRKRGKRRQRDGRSSSSDDSRSRHGRKSPVTTRDRSPSISYEKKTREGIHSDSRERDLEYRRRRADPPHQSRRRHRSPSSSPQKNSFRNYRQDRSRRRSDSRDKSSLRRENYKRSSERQRDGRMEAAGFSRGSEAKERAPERDYSKLIPNFDTMTPAEKVKAKTKLQLSDAVTKDRAVGMSDEWERFDFDKNAPLDDDAKMDGFGDGTGASDDTLFLKNTGSSYLASSGQVAREALVTAKHEASIFGPLEGLPLKNLKPSRETVEGKKFNDGHKSLPLESGPVVSNINSEAKDSQIAGTPANSVVSEQVIAMQQAGSWQDRVRKMKEARKVALQY